MGDREKDNPAGIGIRYQLSWTHYRALLFVKDQKTREYLEKEAAAKSWSRRRLETEILAETARKGGKNDANPGEIGFLERSKGQFYHYQVRKTGDPKKSLNTVPWGQNLDLGFNFFLDGALGDIVNEKQTTGKKKQAIIRFKEDEIVRVIKTGKNSYRFEKSDVLRSEIFTYKAFPERIVDGVTLIVTIDLGFKASTKQRLRFRGIDSPEKGSKVNQKVEKFIAKKLRTCKFIVIRTHGLDIFGRYLSDVYYSEKEKDMRKVLEKGIFLNNELLGSGLVGVE